MKQEMFTKNNTQSFIGKANMKIAGVLVMLFLCTVSAKNVRAQFTNAADYPFKAKQKVFTYLTGGTSVNLQADDRTVSGIPIGFGFTYCGNVYNTVTTCSNGWMSLNSQTSTTWTNSLSNSNSLRPLIMPLFDDLQGSGTTTTYKTSGSPGSRAFVFEWRNTKPLSNTSNIFSMQVVLYEATGAIEFLYKRESGGINFSSATIGISGAVSGDYQTLPNSGANPTPSSTTFTTNITSQAATGQSYFWGVDCPVKFLVHPQNVPACASGTATFTATPDSANAYQWQWYSSAGWTDLGNDVIYSGVNTLNLKINNTQMSWDKYRYRLVATNTDKACSVESDEGLLIMTPSSNSSIVIAPDPGKEVCLGEEVTFRSAYTKGGSAPQYRWMLNGLEIPGAINATLKIDTLDHGDIVQCRFISNQICVFESVSPGVTMDIVTSLLAEVSIQVGYNGGNSYTFIADPKNGGANPRYYWYVNGKLQVGETGQSFTSETLAPWDKVTVGMFTSRECAMPKLATSRQATTGVSGVEASEAGIVLAPNPNKGAFTIQANNLGNSTATIAIINTVGQIVYRAEVQPVQGAFKHQIDLGGKVTSGVYMMNIEVDGRSVVRKFTVAE